MIMEIPEGYFVHNCDLDADEPYCTILPVDDLLAEEKKVLIPKSLAYYLSTHWCGSQKMETGIINDTRRGIRNSFRDILRNELLWEE